MAKKITTEGFGGFPTGAGRFLSELSLNNDKAFFEANRDRYEREVREPAQAFIRAMAKPLSAISSHFVADDRKSGGSLMRVFRDTRFSKDKTPYKTNIGIQFRHAAGKDVHAPGWYVHISPDECFVGAGLWMPEPETLQRIRVHVAEHHEAWAKILAAPAFSKAFRQHTEGLQRVPKGFDKAHPAAEELKRRSFIAVSDLDWGTVESPGLVDEVARRFRLAADTMRFLCDATDQAF